MVEAWWRMWAARRISSPSATRVTTGDLAINSMISRSVAACASASVGASTSRPLSLSITTSWMPALMILRISASLVIRNRLRTNGWAIQSQLRSWMNMPTLSCDASTFLNIRAPVIEAGRNAENLNRV